MNINSLLNNENFVDDFYKFDTSTATRPVVVSWGGTGIHTIAGPTPFVDISKTFNTNDAGVLESIVHTINLTGKVIKPEARGITNVVAGINALENLFKACSTAPLEITCDNNVIFKASGVVIKSMSFNKTEDNWVNSADYSIDLEYKSGPTDDPDEQVEDRTESWTIEPLDDAIYTKFSKAIIQNPEYTNPNLLPRSPTINNPTPSMSVGGGLFGNDNKIQIFTIPQFRITRRLSAKGLVKPPASGNQQCLSNTKNKIEEKKFFLSAKAWVDKQTTNAFNGSSASGSIYFTTNPNISNYKGTWLYNHSRTINADIYNATYEANDTWIAMPTGIPYTETFSIESSTDNDNVKTVRVAGNIQGLSLTPIGIMTGSSGPLPSGTGNLAPNGSIPIDLSYSMQPNSSASISYDLPSISNNAFGIGGNKSKINKIDETKYINAMEAWTKDIKPYLYRRACLVMNTSDRVGVSYEDPKLPPPNHIYMPEALLNVNPVSTSEGHDPIKGTISYNHEFNNRAQAISGVLSENIRISNTAPANLIQETQVLGRALGPILSTAGVSNPRKSISIDIIVPKPTGFKGTLQTDPSCPMYYKGYFWQAVDILIKAHEPFVDRSELFARYFSNNNNDPLPTSQQFGVVYKDSENEDWNPTDGRYSRTVSWIYQQCTADRFYLDH